MVYLYSRNHMRFFYLTQNYGISIRDPLSSNILFPIGTSCTPASRLFFDGSIIDPMRKSTNIIDHLCGSSDTLYRDYPSRTKPYH